MMSTFFLDFINRDFVFSKGLRYGTFIDSTSLLGTNESQLNLPSLTVEQQHLGKFNCVNMALFVGSSHNFVVMKRRNAFWNLECAAESLPHASSLQAATSHSGLLASLTSVNGIGGGGGGTKGLSSPIKPRRTRQFSLQF